MLIESIRTRTQRNDALWETSLGKFIALVVFLFALFALGSSASARQVKNSELLSGTMAGPIVGLRYETPTASGVTNEKGEFKYRAGETVTFSVANMILGSAKAGPRLNLAQLVARVDGNIDKVRDPVLTNMARFVQTLDEDGNVENGVTINAQAQSVIGRRSVNFNQSEEAFAHDFTVTGLLAELNQSKGAFTARTPRDLRSAAAARNELRRNIRGIIKTTDVKIPLRDGSYVYADVFRPADDSSHPVVMNLSVYGKAFQRECICDLDAAEAHEQMEDRYFSGNPDGFQYENHETVNTAQWVPKGYIVIRVDGRGTCKSPGTINVLSHQEAEDYYDSIEWAGKQAWSNGNVGLWGMSYNAMDQENVASLQPPHLKAMIPVATDIVSFEDSLFNGGLLSEEFWSDWWYNVSKAVCGPLKFKDFIAIAKQHPFNDPALYGPEGNVMMSPDMSKVTVPQWISMPTEHAGHLHQLGSSEAFIQAASKEKKLKIGNNWFSDAYAAPTVAEHMAFFDYWLKGEKNGIMDTPPVRISIRTGNGGYYVIDENEWPIAQTKYTKLYLDAAPSNWTGELRKHEMLQLAAAPASTEKHATYSAQVIPPNFFPPVPEDTRRFQQRGVTACWDSGVSFVTSPMPSDMVVAGYMKAGFWVSSTSSDMDIYASLRVIDDHDREVNYAGPPDPRDATAVYPLGIGFLKVSHRKLDVKRSTDYRPKHTDAESDYAPLKKGEIVPVEIELWPDTAVIKKGYRLRLDVQPYDGCGTERHSYDASYHNGAENTIYTGPAHPSYVQLPVIPEMGGTRTAAGN